MISVYSVTCMPNSQTTKTLGQIVYTAMLKVIRLIFIFGIA